VFVTQQEMQEEAMRNEILPWYNKKLNNQLRSMTMKKFLVGTLLTVLSIPVATVDPIIEAIVKIF
jgi:hypothetical protein